MADVPCQSGDFVISSLHGGFLIGRMLPERGPGPWWEYVAKAGNLADAIALAQYRAVIEGTTVWLDVGRGEYKEVPRLSELALTSELTTQVTERTH